MQSTIQTGFQVSGFVQPFTSQVDSSGNPVIGTATLSNLSFDSSDVTVFTVAPDPSTPNGFIVTAVGSGLDESTVPPIELVTATLAANATATETNGVTNSVAGEATVNVTAGAAPPPPPPVTTSLGFVFGTPVLIINTSSSTVSTIGIKTV